MSLAVIFPNFPLQYCLLTCRGQVASPLSLAIKRLVSPAENILLVSPDPFKVLKMFIKTGEARRVFLISFSKSPCLVLNGDPESLVAINFHTECKCVC